MLCGKANAEINQEGDEDLKLKTVIGLKFTAPQTVLQKHDHCMQLNAFSAFPYFFPLLTLHLCNIIASIFDNTGFVKFSSPESLCFENTRLCFKVIASTSITVIQMI